MVQAGGLKSRMPVVSCALYEKHNLMKHKDHIVPPQMNTYNSQYKTTGNHTVLSVHYS